MRIMPCCTNQSFYSIIFPIKYYGKYDNVERNISCEPLTFFSTSFITTSSTYNSRVAPKWSQNDLFSQIMKTCVFSGNLIYYKTYETKFGPKSQKSNFCPRVLYIWLILYFSLHVSGYRQEEISIK